MSNKAFANTTTQAADTLGDATRFVASRGERRASGPTFGLWPHGIAVLWQQLVNARIPQFPPLDGHRPSLSSSAKGLLSKYVQFTTSEPFLPFRAYSPAQTSLSGGRTLSVALLHAENMIGRSTVVHLAF
jgi:hypothetical protein